MTTTAKILLTVIFTFWIIIINPQDLTNQQASKIDSLLTTLNSTKDTAKVNVLNKLSKEFELRDPNKAFQYAEEAVRLSEEIDYEKGLAKGYKNIGNYHTEQSDYDNAIEYFEKALDLYKKLGDITEEKNILNNIGNVHRYLSNYDTALEYFLISLKMSEENEDKQGIAYALNNIGILYAIQEKYDKVLEYFKRTLEISEEIGDKKGAAYSLNNIGLVYEELGDNDKALEYHEKSLKIKEQVGNKNGISSSLKNIGNIYIKMGKSEDALNNHLQALEIAKEIGNKNGIIHSSIDIGKIYIDTKNFKTALNYFSQALSLAKEIEAKGLIKDSYESLSELYERNNNAGKALEYYKLYTEYKDSIFNETSSQRMAEMQTKYETEKKEAEINLLKSEKTIQDLELDQLKNSRIYLTIVLSLLTILSILLYIGYRLKRKANILLEEKNRRDIEDRARVLTMFGQQVSQEIVDELLTESTESASKRRFVCVMFLDIRDFTPFAENREPEEIIEYQNNVFGFMIEIINKNFGVINQFLGDGYMATFGAPVSSKHDCQNAVKAAIAIIETVNEKSKLGLIPFTRIGIGLHAGNVVTGNVGTSIRKQYSITGNTVILASRIEKLNKTFNSQILISKEVLNNIDTSNLDYESLGEIVVKGREEPINIYKLA